MSPEQIPGPEGDRPEENEQTSFSQAGGEKVYHDKTSADLRMNEIRNEEAERTEQLRKDLSGRPDLSEEFDRLTKHENDPAASERERSQLLHNISAAIRETLDESSTILEMNPGSLYSIFKNADEKQVEYWVLLIVERFQELEQTESARRVLALRGLRSLVKSAHFKTATEKYLPELDIDLDAEAAPPPQTTTAPEEGLFARIKKWLGK